MTAAGLALCVLLAGWAPANRAALLFCRLFAIRSKAFRAQQPELGESFAGRRVTKATERASWNSPNTTGSAERSRSKTGPPGQWLHTQVVRLQSCVEALEQIDRLRGQTAMCKATNVLLLLFFFAQSIEATYFYLKSWTDDLSKAKQLRYEKQACMGNKLLFERHLIVHSLKLPCEVWSIQKLTCIWST